MFEQISAKLQKSFKPAAELAAVNVKAMEQLAKSQADLLNVVINSNVEFIKELSTKKDIAGVLEIQKAYSDDLQEKLTAAAKQSFALLTDTQEQANSLMKGALTDAKDTTFAAANKAKETTVAAANKAKETTFAAANKAKETTFAAATKAKETTIAAATKAKDATVDFVSKAKEAEVVVEEPVAKKAAKVAKEA